jgi:hypothetical protein
VCETHLIKFLSWRAIVPETFGGVVDVGVVVVVSAM